MRFTAIFLLSTLPIGATAEVIRAPLAPSAVTVYPRGAMIDLTARIDVPAGQHTLRMPMNPQLAQGGFGFAFEVRGDVTVLSRALSNAPFDPELFYTPAQVAADAALEAAEAEVRGAQDALRGVQIQISAIDAQTKFLSTATAAESETLPSVLQLTELGGAIGAELARLGAERITLNASLPALNEAVEEASEAVVLARDALSALTPPNRNWMLFEVEVSANATTVAQTDITVLTGSANWRTTYEADLSGSALTLEPSAQVQNYSGQSWYDVALTLSTVVPFDRIEGPYVGTQIARIFDPEEVQRLSNKSAGRAELADSFAAAPMMEPEVVIAEAAAADISGRQDGVAFLYDVPGKVTVVHEASQAEFRLAPVDLEAETQILAAPRVETKAFLIADTVNTSAGPILPGSARFHRDGVFIGESSIPEIVPGAEATLPFGTIKGIQLERRILDRQSGDQGIISRSDTREEVVEFDVTNISQETHLVTTLYALPVSEQEDLEINLRLRPEPDVLPYEDRRGVAAWEMELDPGETRTVRIDMALRWPEGQVLNWQP